MKETISHISGTLLGVLFGIILGIALDNLGLWLSLGLAIGVGLDYTIKNEAARNNHKNDGGETL